MRHIANFTALVFLLGVANSARAEMQGLNSLSATFALCEYLILPIPLIIAALYAVIDISAPAWQRIALPTFILTVPATFAIAMRYPNSAPLQLVTMLSVLLLPIVASVVSEK